jgi:hypothetical protein
MAAKYYIYRNLHKGGFSVKYRGKVIKVIHDAVVNDVEFRVSLAGRERALKTKTRNVHAYLVCDYMPIETYIDPSMYTTKVTYNPFKGDTFTFIAGIHNIMVKHAKVVYLTDGRAYL